MMYNLNEKQLEALSRLARYGFSALILILTIAALFEYRGQLYIYLLFTVVSNALLYVGFRKNAIFFDTFIGVFFWLGFWLKLTVRVCFTGGLFHEAVGSFDGSGAAFDQALLVASFGLSGLLIASFVRERFMFSYPKKLDGDNQKGILDFYKNYRNFVLIGFVILFLTIGLTNIHFGIYQKGAITQTTLPFGLNGIYKWLLLFGLASISAVILRSEYLIKRKVSYLVIVLSLLESFSTNVSLLSRGMILNVSALAYGLYSSLRIDSIRLNIRLLAISFLFFAVLFVGSVAVVNYLRSSASQGNNEATLTENLIDDYNSAAKPLFLDRWVGIEGVMAVSSYSKLGWDLWQEALKEKYSENTTSFYDKNLITSPYIHTDFTKHHHISLPGILAFFFYPGSFSFLLGSMFLLGLFAAMIEISVFKIGGNNMILCALMAEVVAYRFASFGYVPSQTYLILGALYLNLFLIYFANKFFLIWNRE